MFSLGFWSSSSSICAACSCVSAAQMCFYGLKRKWQLKPAKFCAAWDSYAGGLLRERICAVKRNRRTKVVAEVIDSGYTPKRSNPSALTLRIPESVVGYPCVRFLYCLTSTQGLPTTGASKKGQSLLFAQARAEIAVKVRAHLASSSKNRGGV